jgi:multidrug/hemolysin transport system ATP-binding protein
VCGFDVERQADEVRRQIGVVFQDNVLDDLLTVSENLASRGELYGLRGTALRKRIDAAARQMDIVELLPRRYGKLSGGQKRRAEVARALMSDPRILFLDEPTTGLDPQTRRKVWEIIRGLRQQSGLRFHDHPLHGGSRRGRRRRDHRPGTDRGPGNANELKKQYSRDTLVVDPLDLPRVEERLRETRPEGRAAGRRAEGAGRRQHGGAGPYLRDIEKDIEV